MSSDVVCVAVYKCDILVNSVCEVHVSKNCFIRLRRLEDDAFKFVGVFILWGTFMLLQCCSRRYVTAYVFCCLFICSVFVHIVSIVAIIQK